jgi:hypothetical protein
MYVPVKKLVVHHTATGRLLTTDAEIEAEVRAIYTYHARTLGWGDVGYGAFIGLNGKSYEGRHGRGGGSSREVFSHDVVAGHAFEHNYGTAGVALIGYFHPPHNMEPSTAMLTRLLDVFEQMALGWQINPHEATDFLKSTGVWRRDLTNVCGHRDCVATACPGDTVYSKMAWIRNQLLARLTTGAPILEKPAPSLTGPGGSTTTSRSLKYSWSGGNGSSYSHYLEGWSKASGSEAIGYLSGFDSSRRPVWSGWSSTKSKSYSGLKAGYYTFHVRSRDASGNMSYQRNKTVYIR